MTRNRPISVQLLCVEEPGGDLPPKGTSVPGGSRLLLSYRVLGRTNEGRRSEKS